MASFLLAALFVVSANTAFADTDTPGDTDGTVGVECVVLPGDKVNCVAGIDAGGNCAVDLNGGILCADLGLLCFVDADGDDWGSDTLVFDDGDGTCSSDGEAARGGDCHDDAPDANPSRIEVVGNEYDDDCSGRAQCWEDMDRDGFGVPHVRPDDGVLYANGRYLCDPDQHEATIGSGAFEDCDDSEPTAHPWHPTLGTFTEESDGGADVIGNAIDEDCDGVVLCWADRDRDGYGSERQWIADQDGDGECATGFLFESEVTGDCYDHFGDSTADGVPENTPRHDREGNPIAPDTVHPGADEIPADGVDQDCNSEEKCYRDSDDDGWAVLPEFALAGDVRLIPSDDLDCDDAMEAWLEFVGDCDDLDPDRHPDAEEIWYDDVDQDCDGNSDFDQDGDGFSLDEDCDDTDEFANPHQEEIPGNGVDEDCSGAVGCYQDLDADEWGSTVVIDDLDGDGECASPGESIIDSDCRDGDPTMDPDAPLIHPGAFEYVADNIDQDCDGRERCLTDSDLDGYSDDGSAALINLGFTDDTGLDIEGILDLDPAGHGGRIILSEDADCNEEGEGYWWTAQDCNDDDPAVHPQAWEIWYDGVDQNCDDHSDFDRDFDGFDIPEDCNDFNPLINPAANDVPGNLVDENCDEVILCFQNLDQDGYGTTDTVMDDGDHVCTAASGESTISGDCHDDNASAHPDGVEVVGNAYDDDCNGTADCFRDLDEDGFGTAVVVADDGVTDSQGHYFCDPSMEEASLSGDCHDDNPLANPLADEIPGNVYDDDCSGVAVCYLDLDGDDYGTDLIDDDGVIDQQSHIDDVGHYLCDPAAGEGSDGGDCDDSSAVVFPGAYEACEGIDNDCDELVDEDCPVDTAGDDADRDGSPYDEDCDDTDPLTYPGASEICDGRDNDCDGSTKDECGEVVGCVGGGVGITWSVLLLPLLIGRRRPGFSRGT